MASHAKKRKMNFSDREVEIIVEEMEKQKHTLVNHFNAGVTHVAKNNAWSEILKRVNAVTNCPREISEVKKKWSDLKTEVRRKVSQARAAIEGTEGGDCTTVPVILTAMQQRICNLLGEATIISLPAGEAGEEASSEITVPMPISGTANTTTVNLAQSIQPTPGTTCEMKSLETTETTYHTLEEGMVEYCTAEAPVTVASEAPVEVLAAQAECSIKPQELKNRIALNSAKLLQEQRVTNLHVREIAQHLENQNDLLQMIRRSQEAQACAQERQAQALEGVQATLLAFIQMFKPALKDVRKYLQNASSGAETGVETGAGIPNVKQQVEDGQ